MLSLIPYPKKVEFIGGISSLNKLALKISYKNNNIEANPEAYELLIDNNKVTISGSSDAGLFYGLKTYEQHIDNCKNSESSNFVKNVLITDSPKYEWRGMHLDVSRHFLPVEFIKIFIDQMSLLKVNRFHWHLTDDQGWRIEIDKYPKLNQISSYRKNSDGQKYGGYYTKDEIRQVVSYAAERFIEVIPEVEMPGHTKAVLVAYPELSCSGGPFEVSDEWGIFDDIFCAGKEQTFEFIFDILDEVIQLFPSKYVHIGGDEAPYTRWKECPDCQRRISDERLKSEKELQNYFISRIQKYLNKNNRVIIGWDEIFNDGISKNISVMAWRSAEIGWKAAEAGHKVIMSPTSHCYFDYYQAKENEPKAIGGFLPLEKVYQFDPTTNNLNDIVSENILGGQGNVWTEYIPDASNVEYMAFPRICAMAEKLWGVDDSIDYDNFIERLRTYLKSKNLENINYRKLD